VSDGAERNQPTQRRAAVAATMTGALLLGAAATRTTSQPNDDNNNEQVVEVGLRKLRRTTWIFYSGLISVVVGAAVVLCNGGHCSLPPPSPSPSQRDALSGSTTKNDTVANVLQPTDGTSLHSSPYASAETLARHWSIHTDPLRNNLTAHRITQRYVLATLFFQPLDWESSSANNAQQPILSADNECDWFGIECDNDNNHVTSIRLPAIQRQGSKKLRRRRQLQQQRQRGTAPVVAGDITDETTLLTATIPSELGLLTRLTLFDMSGNKMDGSLPRHLSYLTLMEHFNVSGNDITGSLPDLYWPNLRSFAMSGLDRGVLPEWIGDSWTSLEQFELKSGRFVSTIPTTMALWTNLRELVLIENVFSGPQLPTNLHQWSSLERLEIVGTTAPRLDSTKSPMPSDIPYWTNLRILQLDMVGLAGTMPAALANLTALEMLSLRSSSDSLIGPVSVGDWPALQHIDLSFNSLTGILPSRPSWTQLVHYEMSGNRFTGGLPADIGVWTSLVRLVVQDQVLMGGGTTIPTEIGQCTKLQALQLQNNAHTGPIPSELAQCTELQTLLLVQNALTGPIPSELSTISTLKELSILSTNITGSIPTAAMWTDLELLDLSNNHLSGTLPVSIGLWTNLVSFRVSGNRLNSSLDNLLSASLPLLGWLELSSNMFSGPLYEPTEQQQQQSFLWFPSLQYFDVGYNLISGWLPSALARWTAMASFRVHNNSLTGTIPPVLADTWTFFSFGEFQGNSLLRGSMPFCGTTTGTTTYITSDCDRVDFWCDCCAC
jgi:Leucine-rich repeat (LRR) protein